MYCQAIHAAPWKQLGSGGLGFCSSPQHGGSQSGSELRSQPPGQQPSPAWQTVIGRLPTQLPLLSQVSTVVQASSSSQAPPGLAGAPPVQSPAEQVSPAVQTLLSLQAPPSLPGTALQVSAFSLHVPTMQTSEPSGTQGFATP